MSAVRPDGFEMLEYNWNHLEKDNTLMCDLCGANLA